MKIMQIDYNRIAHERKFMNKDRKARKPRTYFRSSDLNFLDVIY
jgi:hypothetical protein